MKLIVKCIIIPVCTFVSGYFLCKVNDAFKDGKEEITILNNKVIDLKIKNKNK